jgi:hypothetical protein
VKKKMLKLFVLRNSERPEEILAIIDDTEKDIYGSVVPGVDANYYKQLLISASNENDDLVWSLKQCIESLKNGEVDIDPEFSFDPNKIEIVEMIERTN